MIELWKVSRLKLVALPTKYAIPEPGTQIARQDRVIIRLGLTTATINNIKSHARTPTVHLGELGDEKRPAVLR